MEAAFVDTLEKEKAINSDIIKVLEKDFPIAHDQVKDFSKQFQADSLYETAENVWHYLKDNVKYKADSAQHQKIRLPARLLADGQGDCKSFALAAAAIISWYAPVAFRYTSYRPDPTPTHVYCVVYGKKGEEIIIDPVWYDFDKEKEYRKKYDHKMKISTLSGIDDIMLSGTEVPKIPVDRYTFHQIKHWNDILNSEGRNTPAYNEAKKRLVKLLTDSGIKQELKGGSIQGIENIEGIGKHGRGREKLRSAFKKITHAGKSWYLAMPRNDFLALVRINYRGFATRIANSPDQDKIKKLWVDRLGGNYNALMKAVNKAKNKRALFGSPHQRKVINGVVEEQPMGNPAVLAAIIASAAPILIAIGKLIPKSKPEDAGADSSNPDDQANYDYYKKLADGGSETSFDGKDHDPDSSDSAEKESEFTKIITKVGGVAKTVGELFTPPDQPAGEHQIDDSGKPANEAGMGLLPMLLLGGLGLTVVLSKKRKG